MSDQTRADAQNRARVTRMARVGLPNHQIAAALGVSPKTLHAFYATELYEAPIALNLEVLETLASLATSGKYPSATIYWAKTRCQTGIGGQRLSGGQPLPPGPGFRIEKQPKVLVIKGPDGVHERIICA